MTTTPKRQQPLRITLPFDQFVEGILKVDPAKLPKAKKKPDRAAKKGKANRSNQAKG